MIEREERELIESIIEFGDTVAREVMVPRPDMVTIPHDAIGQRRAGHRHRARLQPAAGDGGGGGRRRRPGPRQGPDAGRAGGPGRASRRPRWPGRPASSPRTSRSTASCARCRPRSSTWPSSSTSTATSPAWSPWRTAWRSWSARSSTSSTGRTCEVVHLPDGSYLVDGGMSIGDLNELLEIELPGRGLGHGGRVRVQHPRATSPTGARPSSRTAGASPPSRWTVVASAGCGCR